ncbi:dgkA [Symbiodinium sp. CCMP2592]|nr:dgkA [Symbiodinium sp. CCMP2592]
MLEGSSGNKPGFHKLREVCSRRPGTPVRAIVGGGDGTVMWADSEATKHGIQTPTQVAWGIVPLGTGNDFSRVAGWGGNNPEGIDENNWELLKTLVMRWANATVRHHDVWEVTINLDHGDGQLLKIGKEQVEEDLEVVSKTFYMVNYFSIGPVLRFGVLARALGIAGRRFHTQGPKDAADSESKEILPVCLSVGMHFDKHRTKSQTCNLFVYGAAGFVQELRCWGVQHVGNIVANLYTGTTKNPDKLILDSEGDAGEPQLIGNPESLMFLNISSYAGGKAHLWQSECDVGVDPPPPSGTLSGEQDPGDGKLEVVTLPLIANIAMDNLVHQARRVCQGESYFLEYFKNDDGMNIYFEVDGEFYHAVNPDSTVVKLYKKLQVLQKNKLDVEESDSDWLDDFVPESMGCLKMYLGFQSQRADFNVAETSVKASLEQFDVHRSSSQPSSILAVCTFRDGALCWWFEDQNDLALALGDFEAELEPMSEDDETEPIWLRGDGIEVPDPKVAEDAEVCAAFLDGLTGGDVELDMAFPQYVPNLARYLVGHPEALVSKKRKGHKKGAGKRYFGAEERSEDVMADKVIVGCWVCGKLDHESQDCVFKRCFVCSEQGHESSECQLRHLSCSRCRRQGHVAEYCPQEVYDDGLNNEADVSFCRCLKCGEEGHINCCEVIPDSSRFIFLQEPSPSEPSLREMGRQGSEDSPSWQPQQQGWNGYRGGWGFDDWSAAGPKAFFDLAPWLLQGAATGNFGWAPPPGDGGGYGGRNGGGGGWRNGNSKGWGGGGWGNGWGRSQSWDDGWSSQKRRRQNY